MNFKGKRFAELTTYELYEILKARCAVFMLEQNIICQDMDDVDHASRHCFLEQDGRVVAYLRAFYTDETCSCVRIGRVLTVQHGIGWGRELMEYSLAYICKEMSCDKICIDAQKHAIGFYEKFGFRITSGEFLEEGVVHVCMERKSGSLY